MSEQLSQTFPMTQEEFDSLAAKLNAAGHKVSGNEGDLNEFFNDVHFKFNPTTGEITLTTVKEFGMTPQQLLAKVDALLQAQGVQTP